MAVPTGTANTMKVGLGILGEVEVDDDVHSLNIDTAGEQVGAHEVAADAIAEVVENTVAGLLEHLGMAVEARISEFRDLLGEELDSVGGVAEDDGLVDLQLGEEGVEAVDLLLLLDVGVVLSNTTEGELVHQVDLIRADHVLIREVLDREGEGGGEEHHLAVLGVEPQELLDDGREFDRQKLVSFVHDEHGAFAKIRHLLAGEIENSSGGTDHNMDGILQPDDIVTKPSSTSGDHDVDAEMFSESLADLGSLHGQFAGRDEDETLDLGDLGVDLFQGGNDEGGGLAGAVLGTGEDITAGQGNGYAFFLDG